MPWSATVQIHLKYQPDDLRFFGYDFDFTVSTHAVTVEAAPEVCLALSEALSVPPFHILAQLLAVALGHACVDHEELLILGVDALDALHLEYHIYIEGPEHTHILDGVQGVSRKPVDGFGEDDIDLPGLAHLNHSVEFIPLFRAGTGDALICKHFHRLPIGVAADLAGIILQLVLIAVELLIGVRADPAIGGHPVFTVEALCGLSLLRRDQGHILCQLVHFRSPFLP